MLLTHGGIARSRALSKVHMLSAYWSAAVHDYEHGGLNNDFLIKTAHPLAIVYNDISPLENHHMSAAVSLIHTPGCDYLPVRPTSCCCLHAADTMLLTCDRLKPVLIAAVSLPCCSLLCTTVQPLLPSRPCTPTSACFAARSLCLIWSGPVCLLQGLSVVDLSVRLWLVCQPVCLLRHVCRCVCLQYVYQSVCLGAA